MTGMDTQCENVIKNKLAICAAMFGIGFID
jgi:hypothetical protein